MGDLEPPVCVVLDSLHEAIADSDRDVSMGYLVEVPLGFDELQQIGVPVVEHEHGRTAPGATLLYTAHHVRGRVHPCDRTRRTTVDALEVGVPRPQHGPVDADPASAPQDVHHDAHRVDDGLATVAAPGPRTGRR